ncbi:MAG: signal peptidase I [Candidatus Babeliales bacterium]|jgi:signal peptidase I
MKEIRAFITWWNRPGKSLIAEYVQAFIVIVPLAFIIRTWGYGLYKVPTGSMETTLLIGESFVSDKFTYSFLRKPQRGEIIAFNEPETEKFKYSENYFKNLWQRYVWGPENWTKRVIGLPGEHVQGKIEDGRPVVYINGVKFEEPYVNQYSLIYTGDYDHPRSYHPDYSYEKQPFYRMDGFKVRQIKRILEEHSMPAERISGTPLVGAGGSDIYDVYLKSKDKDGIDEYWVMGDNRLGSSDSRSFGKLNGDLIHGRILVRLFSVDSNYSWLIFDLLANPLDFWTRVRWSRWFQWVY